MIRRLETGASTGSYIRLSDSPVSLGPHWIRRERATLFIPDRRFTCALNLSGLKRGQLLMIYYLFPAILGEATAFKLNVSSMLNNVRPLLKAPMAVLFKYFGVGADVPWRTPPLNTLNETTNRAFSIRNK